MKLALTLLLCLPVAAQISSFPNSGGSGGVGAAPLTVEQASATTATFDISSFNLTTATQNALFVECKTGTGFSGGHVTGTLSPPIAITLNPRSLTSVTANFSSSSNVVCVASAGGSPGATGPAGSAGASGAAGAVPWTPAAVWSSATAYTAGPPASLVTYQGQTYVAAGASTNVVPGTDGTKWTLVSARPGLHSGPTSFTCATTPCALTITHGLNSSIATVVIKDSVSGLNVEAPWKNVDANTIEVDFATAQNGNWLVNGPDVYAPAGGGASAAGATGDAQCKASDGTLTPCALNDNGTTLSTARSLALSTGVIDPAHASGQPSMSFEGDRQLYIKQRRSTTTPSDLIIESTTTPSGALNGYGGDIGLVAGNSTGNVGGSIKFWVPTIGSSGTTDNVSVNPMNVSSAGGVGLVTFGAGGGYSAGPWTFEKSGASQIVNTYVNSAATPLLVGVGADGSGLITSSSYMVLGSTTANPTLLFYNNAEQFRLDGTGLHGTHPIIASSFQATGTPANTAGSVVTVDATQTITKKVLDSPSMGAGASSITRTATAGTGGVTAKLLAAKDSTDPTRRVLPGSGGCGGGFAAATATVGNAFELIVGAGLTTTGVADNAVTAGHILIGGTTTPGRVRDSGQTSRAAIDPSVCLVGVALAGASTGADVLLEYDGPGSYGAGPDPTKASLSGAAFTGAVSVGGAVTITGTVGKESPLATNAYYTSGLNVNGIAKNQLATFNGNQYIGYYNQSRVPVILKRNLSTNAITTCTPSLPASTNDDEHKVISIAADKNGFLHLSYGMHNDAMIYYRSNAAENCSAFTSGTPMVASGVNEDSNSYPMFLKSPSGELYLTFREGGTGNGYQYFYHYNATGLVWEAATGTGTNGLVIDGHTGPYSAYLNGLPKFDSSGNLWFQWEWSTGGSALFNQYLIKWNGTSFLKFDDSAQTIPATPANLTAIMTISTSTGLSSQSDFAIDSAGVFYIPYVRNDANGNIQVWVAESSTGSFVEHQLTFGISTPSQVTSASWGPTVFVLVGAAYVVHTDVIGKELGAVVWASKDHFATATKNYLTQQYNPNWAMNLDPDRLAAGSLSFLYMSANDYQYGGLYIDTSTYNTELGKLSIIDWAPSVNTEFPKGLPAELYARLVGGLLVSGVTVNATTRLGVGPLSSITGSAEISGTAPASASGNGTAASPTLTVDGVAGGSTTSTGTNTGGTGSTVAINGGNGGTATGAGTTSTVGGAGGAVTIQAGAGGTGTNGNNSGGNGGNVNILAGGGGNKSGSGTLGVLGNISLTGPLVVDSVAKNNSGVIKLTASSGNNAAYIYMTGSGGGKGQITSDNSHLYFTPASAKGVAISTGAADPISGAILDVTGNVNQASATAAMTESGFTADASYTVGLLGCPTSTGKIANCASGTNPPVIGILLTKASTKAVFAFAGMGTVTFNSATAVTVGDFICVDAINAGMVIDNSSTPCTTKQIGVVLTTAASATTQSVWLQLGKN